MAWLLLGGAIATEIVGTVALKVSAGMSRLGPSAIVVVGYGLSFWLLALALKHMSVSTAYAVWSAVGTAMIALIGVMAFHEPMGAVKILGIGLIIVGVVAINFGGAH
jgi:small multidrug resistance pump